MFCVALLTMVASLTLTAGAEAWTREDVADYALRGERAWAALTDPATGAVTETIAPGWHATAGHNYGTLLLADAQLRAASRTGDDALARTAVAVVEGFIARVGGRVPADPFSQFAMASILADGRAGRLHADAFARLEAPLVDMVSRFVAFTGHGFTDPAVFDNWRLVSAAASARIVFSELAEQPALVRAEVRRIVAGLVPANAGPAVRTRAGIARVLSDPGRLPHAYHVFSTVLLEHIYETDPEVFDAAALTAREEAGRYALALMAPDGQLTHSGRSMEQSFVLAAAVDLGALRAAQGGPSAARWRAFAERALDRLVRVHGTFADGTIPVVPGLRTRPDQDIADVYSSLSQYNGLTLYFIEHAAAHWPSVPTGTLPADHRLSLTADLAGSGLVWGRAHGVWWAIQGRRAAGDDGRYAQGIAWVKLRTRNGWRDVLAARPRRGGLTTDWRLLTRRGVARLVFTRATGSGAHAVLSGHWRLAGRRLRPARWDVRASGNALRVTTEPVRRGEIVQAAVWARRRTRTASGRVSGSACTVTATGRACARRIRSRGPGPVRVSVG